MLNKIVNCPKLSITDCFTIELDRIVIFVSYASEVNALRELNLHHFEFTVHNYEQGTISHFFFLENINLELMVIKNYPIASNYLMRYDVDLISRLRWQQTKASPFGLIFHYASNHQRCSRRRSDRSRKSQPIGTQPLTRINFSLQNVRNLTEPICWMVPKSLTAEHLLDNTSAVKRKLLAYNQQKSRVANIRITLSTFAPLSNAFSTIVDLNPIEFGRGYLPSLELKLDGDNLKQAINFSSIPIVFT